ncbi:MAG: serine protease, partial [Kiritimatiellales bacterium]|nr:serine protease [Kiritimatiellales bacterium]
MRTRQLSMLCVLFGMLSLGRGDATTDALQSLSAPTGEFVRMPAKYVLQKLERTADGSGLAALQGFKVESRLEGLGDQRISIHFEGMNLFQALEAVAEATGAGVQYNAGSVVLMGPAAMVAPVEEPVAVEPVEKDAGKKDKPAITFSDIDSALVFVETGSGRGSGFIAEMDGKTYLFSNQHNFLGADNIHLRAMHGGLLEPVSFEFCKTRDLVRFELKTDDAKNVKVLQLAEGNPEINQPITVYGNSAGGNVATELKGKILGVGPSDIEVDADIVPGNSGSPVLDARGRVLGVATYITFGLELAKDDHGKQIYQGTRFKDARRYGVRIPGQGWVAASMPEFLNQTYRLVDLQHYFEALYVLVQYWDGHDDYADQARTIMSAYSSAGNRVKPPYAFHSSEIENELGMVVKAFQRNHDELMARVKDSAPTKSELKELNRNFGKRSVNQIETVDSRIRNTFLNKVKRMQDQLNQYEWMSRFLEDTAKPL